MLKLLPLLILLSCSSWAFCLDQTVYINKGETTVGTSSISFCAFNSSEELNPYNTVLNLPIEETLQLTVVNTDSLVHTFTIDGVIETDNEIAGGEEVTFELTFPNEGTFHYYSDVSYGKLIGANGIVLVGMNNNPAFYWNLFDLNKDLTTSLANTSEADISIPYQPELFLINGAHFPNTLEDPSAIIEVQLNQEITIAVVNGGNMDHVLHFHGFHVEIVEASIQSSRTGWLKDSVVMKKGEAVTLKLIPNQLGTYPVHDHNLIAVTNTGFYPGGMLTQIIVSE
ncbi:MAG: multicopper oxidase domain-containing protein [Flavobacteriales bacterium]|nr:multicopper oxidase domain-containing protein [Flavobacteriales bacterium]MDG1780790.1 multicopper oxidase domain-containing protein [Flavobacteriales bacterium]MDG2247103.1 multicopper oxidase domain-containing protein [Flavobacteriales bacterium]